MTLHLLGGLIIAKIQDIKVCKQQSQKSWVKKAQFVSSLFAAFFVPVWIPFRSQIFLLSVATMLYFALLNHFLFAAKVFLRDVKVVWLSTLHAPVTEACCENDLSLLRNVKNCHELKCKR